jgi:hypothetical protein
MDTEFKAGVGTGGIGEVLQANWIPLSLIGVGVAWLVASNTGLAERVAQDERVHAAGRKIGEIAGELGIGGSEPESGHGQQLFGPDGQPLSRGGEGRRGNGWVHQAADAARGALGSVRGAGSAMLDRAGKLTDYAGDAGDLTKRASGQLAERLERDPWLMGVAGLVAGALLAAVIPPTRVEQEYIEETREGLRSKATELGHEAAERVRELADTTNRSANL